MVLRRGSAGKLHRVACLWNQRPHGKMKVAVSTVAEWALSRAEDGRCYPSRFNRDECSLRHRRKKREVYIQHSGGEIRPCPEPGKFNQTSAESLVLRRSEQGRIPDLLVTGHYSDAAWRFN